MSNSPRNGSELGKMASLGDGHLNARRGSSIVEIPSGPKRVSNIPQNGPESAKTSSVDDRHVSASLGSTTMEIASGPEKGE